ncbi:MAG TPA: ATP synthase F1 subunit delta [Acidimicrobiales bacterium]|nr:ATP synthase F1 subunit delta [Acidimicrobiales bacterium]
MAADTRIEAYAEAMFEVARAEGTIDEVEDELFRFARALEGSDELRTALTDPHIPASRRQQIVEDLLGPRATSTTTALVSMVVGIGRGRDLPAIIDSLVKKSAASHNKEVAEVRSVAELNPVQLSRLTDAIEKATGKTIEVKVVIDPSILGGLVTTVGDTVIDGSVRTRLDQLKNIA